MDVQDMLKALCDGAWVPPEIEDFSAVPVGDMPGDKVAINQTHVGKAVAAFRELIAPLALAVGENAFGRAVVSVSGGSGVGKSEIASLLAYYLNHIGVGSYVLSGDNYPHRMPVHNDAERLRVYRQSGVKNLIASGKYTAETARALREAQEAEADADPALDKDFPWIKIYRDGGRRGLKNYLGSPDEIGFDELSDILSLFKNGSERVFLKRMGRAESALWYDKVELAAVKVIIVEWTHGNSDRLRGVDIPILLNSTPRETLEHRRLRGRDGKTDSPFTTTVLGIEQEQIRANARKARVILSKDGAVLTYGEYQKLMAESENGGAHE